MYIKVKDHQNLVRDSESKAILNIDTQGYYKYKEERERILKIKQIASQNEALKNELDELRALVNSLMDKK